jgi:hypothetical protein
MTKTPVWCTLWQWGRLPQLVTLQKTGSVEVWPYKKPWSTSTNKSCKTNRKATLVYLIGSNRNNSKHVDYDTHELAEDKVSTACMIEITLPIKKGIFLFVMTRRTMISELEGIWKKAAVLNLWYYPGICLEDMRKTTKNLGRDYNPVVQPLHWVPRILVFEAPRFKSPVSPEWGFSWFPSVLKCKWKSAFK